MVMAQSVQLEDADIVRRVAARDEAAFEALMRRHNGRLFRVARSILKDDNGWRLLHALRTVFGEWKLCEGHPARNQLLVGLGRWSTDVRKRAGSQSAAQTAQRFARGQTAVDLYES